MMALFKKIRTFCAATSAALCLIFSATGWAAFTDNGNGTVTDTDTGLVWDRCPLGLSGAACATGTLVATSQWVQALEGVSTRNTSSHLGFDDWRLPNIQELQSIVNLSAVSPAIDGAAFPNTPGNFFWSSTTYAPTPANTWTVNFDGGGVFIGVKTLLNGSRSVRLVRGGQPFAPFDALVVAQMLTFGAAPSGVLVGGTPTVAATSGNPNSGNAIVYGSTTPTICTVNSSTGLVTTLAAGTCTITADQAGNASYSAAPQVSQSFSVGLTPQVITFPAQSPATQIYSSGGTFAINPTATGGASGNAVIYSSTTPTVCTVAGTTVTIIAVGTCTIAADQAGNATYAAAIQVTQNVAIGQAVQIITFPVQSPATQTFVASGIFPINPTATGGASGNAVIYSSTTPTVCTVASTTVTIVAVGTCTIAADQAGNANYAAATQVTQNVAIGQAAQTIAFTGSIPTIAFVGGTLTVVAVSNGANSGNPITYTSAAPTVCTVNLTSGAVNLLAVGACTITADQAGDASFTAGQATLSFNVVAAPSAAAARAVPALGGVALAALALLMAGFGVRRRAR